MSSAARDASLTVLPVCSKNIRFGGVKSGRVSLRRRDLGSDSPQFAWLRQGILALWSDSRPFRVS
jgi:hypothetical protein